MGRDNYNVPELLGTRYFGDELRMSKEAGEDDSGIAASGSLFLGKTVADETEVLLPVQAFKRHFMALGGSGSGKTVVCKCVVEEAVGTTFQS